MLIINADDFGGSKTATDNSLVCYKRDRITSASAMVFMSDSERAAELALEHGFDVGLHLNFTTKFNGKFKSSKVIERQQRIAAFLRRSKYYSVLYNPFLKNDFEYTYHVQYEEYLRLYNKEPTHIDGHHHMHLCTNLLVDKLIPMNSKVRRSFTFSSREKNILNRFYRRIVDSVLKGRHTCTDFLFSLLLHQNAEQLQYIMQLAISWNVELMVHPERKEEFEYLLSDKYSKMISLVQTGNYSTL